VCLQHQQTAGTIDASIDAPTSALADTGDATAKQVAEPESRDLILARQYISHGIERGASQLAVFKKGNRRKPIVGRVVGAGLVDEITDRPYVGGGGGDGRAHYTERRTPRPIARSF
jgi:Protein of unknown function (DUF3363)